MSYTYTIKDVEELRSLTWLADRYVSADLLLDCAYYSSLCDDFPIVVSVPEYMAWEILEATVADGADRGIVPCLGGRLGEEIMKMLESVV